MPDQPLPTDVYVCKRDDEWPLHIFESQQHAIAWLNGQAESARPRVWKCSLTVGLEMTLTAPAPPRLVPKYVDV